MQKYILALDQGTTSSRAIVFDHSGKICSVAQKEFTQHFPKPGWVEHDPNEIWSSEAAVIAEAISAIDINGLDIAAIGITNQRETTIVWDIDTEEPIYNAIVWQDRRTAEYCDKLKAQGLVDKVREKTGLIIDAYFSGTKIKWILDNVPGARERAEKGKLRFGNVDSWLVWRLTRGEVHCTDVTNASRTMLFNINTLQWDDDLLKLLDIPRSMMPEVKSSSEVYGHTKTTIFAHEVEELASSVPDSGGVYFVPALTGLAAPYWDQYARGTIVGITRGTTRAHIARAALDGIAFQTYDIAQAMARDLGAPLTELKVDGGASRNNLLMQFQSNLLGIPVVRPKITETTALGAAYLAGLAVGFWKNIDEIKSQWQVERTFNPVPENEEIENAKKGWQDAIQRTLTHK